MKNKNISVEVSAQEAELLVSNRFIDARDDAHASADGDGELYRAWRENTDRHLGQLAQIMTSGDDLEQNIWNIQQDIALATLEGESIGPFSKLFYHASMGGKPIEARPGKDITVEDLPEGDYDVVATNNKIVDIARSEEDPLTFLKDSLKYTQTRRQRGGGRFEGPENYATALKLFTDKVSDDPLDGFDQMERAHRLVSDAVGNFLRISERDAPNVVELMNVLVSIRNLPKEMVDKRFSAGILKHTLAGIDDFGDNGMNIILGAMANMDFEECPEAAAMTADLVLRKGSRMHRTSDMLTALRAVARLPRSDNSEHAVTTLFDVRNDLELTGDIPQLVQMNKLLLTIVNNVTENPKDSIRAKSIASYISKKAVDMLADESRSRRSNPAELDRLQRQVNTIIETAKRI